MCESVSAQLAELKREFDGLRGTGPANKPQRQAIKARVAVLMTQHDRTYGAAPAANLRPKPAPADEIELAVLCPDGATAAINVARHSLVCEAKLKILESRGVSSRNTASLFVAGSEDELADGMQLKEACTLYLLLSPWSDRRALEALFTFTGGETWTKKKGWMTDVDLSEWEGVLTNEEGRVTKITLPRNNLLGQLPSELQMLDVLESLDLKCNGLSGRVPSELGQLSSLKELQLAENRLSGLIPPGLGRLVSLEYLELSFNGLSGRVPWELGQLSSLSHLWLIGNQLSGPIPPELGWLSSVEDLSLCDNQLTGNIPSELARLPRLGHLGLSGNLLSNRTFDKDLLLDPFCVLDL